METMPRESWTDERLDDFRGEVSRRFDETNRRIDETNRRMEAGFAEIRLELRALNHRLDAMNDSFNERFDRLQQLMIRVMVVFGVALLATLIAAVLQN